MTNPHFLPFTGQVTVDNNQDPSGNTLRVVVQLQATHDDYQELPAPLLQDNLLYRLILIDTVTGEIIENYVGPIGVV